MIRPFGLRDVLAIRALQQTGIWLDLYHFLIHRRSALATALIAPIPWRGTGLASYVWQAGEDVGGFVQMLKRHGGAEADLLFLAPALDSAQPRSEDAWRQLLTHCSKSAGEQGVRRLFASLPEGSRAIEVLAALGYAIYTSETIYRLAQPSEVVQQHWAAQPMREQQEQDTWWLRRLYNLYTPAPVQNAEAMGDKDEPSAMPQAWWELSRQRSYVLAENGEVRGAVQLIVGRYGNWLLLHGDPGNSVCMTSLVRHGLSIAAASRQPIYCSVRNYQGGLPAVLRDHGFALFAQRSRLVKHTVARLKASELAPAPSLAIEHSP